MANEEDRIRLRLHWGGTFQPVGPPHQYQWRYVGGEVFNASVPANSRYADLCLKLNDTVGYTTSVKYQAPGEELVPDELVSITGEDDLQELYDEYRNAMRRPAGKPFRVKMFLFPALQTELETDPRAAEVHAQPFNPDEWCIGEEQADDEVTLEDDATLSGLLSDVADREDLWRDEDMQEGPSSTDPSCAYSEMQWEQPLHMMPASGAVGAVGVVHAQLRTGRGFGGGGGGAGGAYAAAGDEEDDATGGVGPSGTAHVRGNGGAGSSGGGAAAGAGLFGADRLPTAGERPTQQQQQRLFQGLDQFAFGNLLQSISRSAVLQRPTGITEEMDLLDPYHEQDFPGGPGLVQGMLVHGHLPQQLQQQQQRQVGAAGHAGGAGDADVAGASTQADHMTAFVRLQEHLPPKGASGNRYGSLVGNLPSHISIFGSDGGQGGRALSAGGDGHTTGGGDEADSGGQEVRGPDGAKWGGVQLPSHISVFGSSTRDEEEASEAVPELGGTSRRPRASPGDLGAGAQRDSKCLTQEFSRDGSIGVRPGDLMIGTPLGGNTPGAPAGRRGGAGLVRDAAEEGEEGGAAAAAAAAGLRLDAAAIAGAGAAGAGAGAGCDSPPASTPKLLEEVVQVPLSEVQIIRKIGEGAFGEVSLANVSSHGLVAIKWLKKDRFAKYSESFMREAEVLAKLNHPNIIRMYGVVIEPVEAGHSHASSSTMLDSSCSTVARTTSGLAGEQQPQCIIAGIMTDYVRGGSLSGQLRAAKRRPTLKERCQVAVQAARGMAFLHAQNPAVIHFDLKPDNLLVDGDGETLHVKVADFGLSKHKFQTFVSCRDLRGTLPYMAPELVSNPNQVSERCDVWSMGVVMWEMYTLQAPYSELSAQQILMALMHGNIHLHVPSSCEPEWRSLIEMCMDPKPETRPSFRQLTIILDKMLRQLM